MAKYKTDMIYYLIFINIVGLLSMYLDKYFAKNIYVEFLKKIFFIAIIGGSIGSIMRMYQFRHKTKHRQFTTGLPFIIFIQIMILIYYT